MDRNIQPFKKSTNVKKEKEKNKSNPHHLQ
jgi:hypothetical protein